MCYITMKVHIHNITIYINYDRKLFGCAMNELG